MRANKTYTALLFLVIGQFLSAQSINWSTSIGNVGNQIKPQSPAIANDGTIYIGSEDNGNFHAINPDGTLKWTYTGISEKVDSSASIGVDGTIYVGSRDNSLHAINPDGSQKWTFPTNGDIIYSTPAIATDGTIYFGSYDDHLYAVNPNGTQKWKFVTPGFNVPSSPSIGSDGTVYFASDNNFLYALNPTNGTEIWSYNLGGDVDGSVVLDTDGTIFVGVDKSTGNGSIVALHPDGTLKWESANTGRVFSTPAINNDVIYFGTKDTNKLYALNISNGDEIWSYTTGDIINSSPAIGDDGKIYFGSFDDQLYCLNPDGTLNFSMVLTAGQNIWSSPAITKQGDLIIGSYDGKLYSISIPSTGLADSNWPMFGKNLKHTSSEANRINWAYDVGASIRPQSPAVADDGTIYIGSEDNTNFHAINSDGTLKWTYSEFTENVYSSASIGVDGTIYVGSKDDSVHAISPNGIQLWQFPVGGDVIYSTPALANDGTIYIGTDANNFYAINPDGTQKWVYNATAKIRSTPSISSDGTVYLATDDDPSADKLHALNPVDGTEIWTYNFGGDADVEGCIVLDSDGTIFVGVDKSIGNGSVIAINPDGSLKWESNNTGRVFSSPAINNGVIYFGTKDTNKLYALDIANGNELWSYTTGDIINSSPAIGDDGKIYFGSFDDKVYCLNPDGTLNFSMLLTQGNNIWSSPAITSSGDLIVGSYDGNLYSIDIPSNGLANSNWPMFGKNTKHTSSNDTTERFITYTDAEGYDPIDPNGLTMDYGVLTVEDGTAHLNLPTTLKNIIVKPEAVLGLEADLSSNITFESNAAGSGQIAAIPEGVSITGEISVERFIPSLDNSRRAFRYVTSSVDSYGSIYENWQENGNTPAGYGTHITGSTQGLLGFDATQTGNPSMFLFDNSLTGTQDYSWLSIPNTDTRQLFAGEPYVIMIRGDRNYNLNSNPADSPNSNVTLRAKGDLKKGNYIPPLSTTDAFYSLVGNPYQSKVDYKDLAFSGDIKSTLLWQWNPNLGSLGGYEVLDELDEQIIQPGQSFFVQNSEVVSTPPTITFSESSKEPAGILTTVFSTTSVVMANLALYHNNQLLDQVKFRFESGANNAIDDFDGGKLGNMNENLASVNTNKLMALERRDIPVQDEVIPLYVGQLQFTEYVFKLNTNNWMEGVQVALIDHYLESENWIDNEVFYPFTVDFSIPESVSEDRFELKFDNTNLSTMDLDFNNPFVIYPNPSSNGLIHIQIENNITSNTEVTIYNLLGHKVFSEKIENITNTIKLEHYPMAAGMYIVELKIDNKKYREKLIIN